MNPRRRSTPVSVSVLEYLPHGDASLGGPLSAAYQRKPRINGRSRRQSRQFGSKVLLHRLSLQSRAGGEFISNLLGDIADIDLNAHSFIMLVMLAF